MSAHVPEANIAIALLAPECDSLLDALRRQHWDVMVTGSVEELLAAVAGGKHDAAIVVATTPEDLPVVPVRALLGMQTDLAVGIRYGGSSITKGTVSPLNSVVRSSFAQITAKAMPIT